MAHGGPGPVSGKITLSNYLLIMPQFLRLRGRDALSAFRRKKLLQAVAADLPGLEINAEFWHFIQLQQSLDANGQQQLERVLTYGPATAPVPQNGTLLLVTPRLGTISPWSSKATEIAKHCGLPAVARIERGIAWWCTAGGKPLTPEQRAAKRAALEARTVKQVMRRAKEMERLATAPVKHGLGEFLDASVVPAAAPKGKKAKKQTVEKLVEKTVEKLVEKLVERMVEKMVEQMMAQMARMKKMWRMRLCSLTLHSLHLEKPSRCKA